MPNEELNRVIATVAKDIVRNHPNPGELLKRQLDHITSAFVPRNPDITVEYTVEFIHIAAKYASIILLDHADDHPERAVDCVPEIQKFLSLIFEDFCAMNLAQLCKDTGIANPLKEKSVNERTFESILDDMKRDHSGG